MSPGQDGYLPIADYALIGDCHGAALVSRTGSIDWCCFHRVDASPVFARILDHERGGYWEIHASDDARIRRNYVERTNVLETTFETSTGIATLIDLFVIADDDDHPPHQIIRALRGVSGTIEMHMRFRPRFDYGLTIPRYDAHDDHTGIVYGGADGLIIESSIELTPRGTCTVEAKTELTSGDEAYFVVTYNRPHELDLERLGRERVGELYDGTCRFWREWSDRCSYDGEYREHVVRSALVLKALTNAPTGAIVAAPTTSLPEEIGGVRNWDYRYAWLRDSALNLYSLFGLGYTGEAHAFMDWVRRTTAGSAGQLQILYGVGGERRLPEIELEHLEGYRGSRPVRIGNAATKQFQLDLYGYLLDTAWLYHRNGGDIDEGFWTFLSDAVEVAAERWREPDDGIWEVRGGPRHFVSSKVFAWVALDRGIRLARALGAGADLDRWRKLRTEIRRCIEDEGVDPETGAFTQELGGEALDASALLIPLVRFLSADDPRMIATIDRIADELTADGLVYRYVNPHDGLPGGEATFAICSFWLVDNLALAGRIDEARTLFERLLSYLNDVGLMSEEIEPQTGELLGNFPQAFSHVGLVGAALNIDRAVRAQEGS